MADDARAMARRIGDPATLMRVLYLVGNPIMVPSLMAERVADTAEALAIAETLGEPALLHGACAYAVTTAMQSGDFEEADRCLEMMRTLSARLQQPALTWMSTFIYRSRCHHAW